MARIYSSAMIHMNSSEFLIELDTTVRDNPTLFRNIPNYLYPA